MRIAFIVDPLDHLKPAKDSTVAMMRAAVAQGHHVWAITSNAIFATERIMAEAVLLQLWPGDAPWYSEIDREITPLSDFDVVLVRKDPPFDMEYITMTWLLQRAEAAGARIFNRPQALRDHSEKLAILEFPQFTVPHIVSSEKARLDNFINHEGDVIIKPLDGMGGREIFRVRFDDPNRNVILEVLTHEGKRTVIAQRYISDISEGDKRITVVAGQVVPYSLARIPKAGETRGNLATGGTGIARDLSARDREIAEGVAAALNKRGVILIGLDVIGNYLTEINITSPTCMVEIHKQTGFDSARLMIESLEAMCV